MSDPTKIHVHTSDDGPCGYCSGVDCPMRYCPGCPPGCALAEDEPDSTSDVRSVSPARGPECPESVAGDGPGVTQSPSGYPSDPPPLKGPQNRVERVSDAEAAEWAALADAATEGPWRVSGRTVLGEGYGAEFVGIPDTPADAAFVAKSREIVPRLLADRERLTAEREALWADHAALLALHEVEVARRESFEARVTRLTADLDAMEAEDSREDVRAKHWTEVLRVRRELAGVRGENNDAMEVIARGLGYSSSDFPLDRWPHLAMTGDHTSVSLAEEVVGRLGQACDFATRVEAENARMVEWNAITTRAFETTRRVLQEASGLPDDIDDPDCRDEMVLALRPRAEKAEAEVARLREGIEALADQWEADPSNDRTAGPPQPEDYGMDLRALLAEGGE